MESSCKLIKQNVKITLIYCNRTLGPVPHFRFRGRLEIAKERLSLWNKLLSLVILMLCAFQCQVPRVVFKIATINRPWYPEKKNKKKTVLVFGCLSAPRR